MRILFVNKYLYRKGGAETYFIKLGEYLASLGHEVEYFGMADERNNVGNSAGAYTDNIDFHKKSLKYIAYPFKIIYSFDAAAKIRAVIEKFKPDIAHLNNFNFQLTPSVIYELKKHNIPIVYTAHDVQLVCPNHKLINGREKGLCRECLSGKFSACVKNSCVHSSRARSALAAAEARIYRKKHTYRMIDRIICPSEFIKKELEHNPDLAGRCVTMHNYIDEIKPSGLENENYVLYFGRYDREKGIETIIKAARSLPRVQFVFAGAGEMEKEINSVANIRNAGFKSGKELREITEKAAFSVLASEWAENCPFSVMESQTLLTPVIGADIGGIPELIEDGVTGLLFKSGSAEELTEKIEYLYDNRSLRDEMSANCASIAYDTISVYSERLVKMYEELNVKNKRRITPVFEP